MIEMGFAVMCSIEVAEEIEFEIAKEMGLSNTGKRNEDMK